MCAFGGQRFFHKRNCTFGCSGSIQQTLREIQDGMGRSEQSGMTSPLQGGTIVVMHLAREHLVLPGTILGGRRSIRGSRECKAWPWIHVTDGAFGQALQYKA